MQIVAIKKTAFIECQSLFSGTDDIRKNSVCPLLKFLPSILVINRLKIFLILMMTFHVNHLIHMKSQASFSLKNRIFQNVFSCSYDRHFKG